jgi:hypothetical protein
VCHQAQLLLIECPSGLSIWPEGFLWIDSMYQLIHYIGDACLPGGIPSGAQDSICPQVTLSPGRQHIPNVPTNNICFCSFFTPCK